MVRKTIQQWLVLETVQRLCHPSAEEIYRVITHKYPSISRGTVYRNLHNMSESGALKQVSIPGGADRFDITTQPHYHAVCKYCGCVQDAMLPYQEQIQDVVLTCDGFIVEKHDIIFWGVCKECAQKEHVGKKTSPATGG